MAYMSDVTGRRLDSFAAVDKVYVANVIAALALGSASTLNIAQVAAASQGVNADRAISILNNSAQNLANLKAVAVTGSYADLSNKPDFSPYATFASLATIATSGNYSDLINKPTFTQITVTALSLGIPGAANVHTGATPIIPGLANAQLLLVSAMAANTATGSNIVLDINKSAISAGIGGVTVFADQNNRPSFTRYYQQNVATQNVFLSQGDALYVDVDAVGSNVAGSDISVTLLFGSLP